jgi:hypothetical protein
MTFCAARSRGPDFWCTVPKFVATVCYESNCVANEKCVAKPPGLIPTHACFAEHHRIALAGQYFRQRKSESRFVLYLLATPATLVILTLLRDPSPLAHWMEGRLKMKSSLSASQKYKALRHGVCGSSSYICRRLERSGPCLNSATVFTVGAS